ncbi:MAG: SMI1/KNR4 family protein, partial [Ruminococcus sp.]|nr:SMI1/KNR4 family protein [Ruminococcus sp.]
MIKLENIKKDVKARQAETCMYKDIIDAMKQQEIEFAIGLKDEEINVIEQIYEIVFPEELKKFYKEALPISSGFYNWRDKSAENVKSIKKAMQIPIQGIIENSLEIDWNEAWGVEPIDSIEREIIIKDMVLKAPKLIPIYSHQYM